MVLRERRPGLPFRIEVAYSHTCANPDVVQDHSLHESVVALQEQIGCQVMRPVRILERSDLERIGPRVRSVFRIREK